MPQNLIQCTKTIPMVSQWVSDAPKTDKGSETDFLVSRNCPQNNFQTNCPIHLKLVRKRFLLLVGSQKVLSFFSETISRGPNRIILACNNLIASSACWWVNLELYDEF